jgi:hypothetical protein
MSFLKLLFSLILIVIGLLFVFFTWLVFDSEVSPALSSGTLSVKTSTMILNRNWAGNEIYLLLAIYTAVAAGLTAAGFVFGRNTLRIGPDSKG